MRQSLEGCPWAGHRQCQEEHRMWCQSRFPIAGKEDKRWSSRQEVVRVRGCEHRVAPDEGCRGPMAGGVCTLLFPLELGQLQTSGNARVGQWGALRNAPSSRACAWSAAEPVGEWRRLTGWTGCRRPGLGPRRYKVCGLYHWGPWWGPWLSVAGISVAQRPEKTISSPWPHSQEVLAVGRLPLHLPCSVPFTWAIFLEREQGEKNPAMREKPRKTEWFSEGDWFKPKGDIFYLQDQVFSTYISNGGFLARSRYRQ